MNIRRIVASLLMLFGMSAALVIMVQLFTSHAKINAVLLFNLALFAITSFLLGRLVLKKD